MYTASCLSPSINLQCNLSLTQFSNLDIWTIRCLHKQNALLLYLLCNNMHTVTQYMLKYTLGNTLFIENKSCFQWWHTLISTMSCTVKTHTNTNFIHNLKAALTPNFIDTPHIQTYWCVLSPWKLQCYWQQEKREWVISHCSILNHLPVHLVH